MPAEIGNLAQLQDLRAENNQLSGEIPDALVKLAALTRLWIGGNRFTGRLPSAIGEMRSLQNVYLDANHELTGLLPRSLLELRFLARFSYGATGLCAQIDEEFQKLLRAIPEGHRTDCEAARVERLALGGLYDMTGGPSWANRGAWGTDAPLGDWHGVGTDGGHVVELTLPANGLSGPLPAEIGNVTELRRLDLEANDLSGGLPRTLAWLADLSELGVPGNSRLAGPLPFAMKGLTMLRVLNFQRTGLCASPSAGFQSWFASIPTTTGPTAPCGNPPEPDRGYPYGDGSIGVWGSTGKPSREMRRGRRWPRGVRKPMCSSCGVA